MPASQPEISAVLVGVHPMATDPAAGSALLSLQSYSTTSAALIADTKNAGWSASRVSLARGGRWLPRSNEHTSPDTPVATATTVRSWLSLGLRCQQKFVRHGVRQRSVLDVC